MLAIQEWGNRVRKLYEGSLVRTVSILSALLIAGCASTERGYDVQTAAPKPDMSLGPGDTFEVSVYDEKELSGKYQVADDGNINFPLIGAVKVAGKTPNTIALELQDTLRDKQILRNPSVSLFVLQYASRRLSVVGAVQKPGNIDWIAGMSVVQAISMAGGLTPLADANDTIVTRQEGTQPKRYKVQVRRIAEGREKDFMLLTGDIVFVPERLF
ncbi:MAG TPA: polysaccharide biosynthesis/export family protein [Polyangiales bacterium]|nr:polysaccharide biosynthesis/export family protein [Polyangiales bacterium]